MLVEYIEAMDAFDAPSAGEDRIDGAWDKMIVRGSGIDMPIRLLSPYQGFDDDVYEQSIGAVRERFPEWLG